VGEVLGGFYFFFFVFFFFFCCLFVVFIFFVGGLRGRDCREPDLSPAIVGAAGPERIEFGGIVVSDRKKRGRGGGKCAFESERIER